MWGATRSAIEARNAIVVGAAPGAGTQYANNRGGAPSRSSRTTAAAATVG